MSYLATTFLLNKSHRCKENRANSACVLKILAISMEALAASCLIQLPVFPQINPSVPITTTTSCVSNKKGSVCQTIQHPVGATVTTTNLSGETYPKVCQQITYPPQAIVGFTRCTTNQNGTLVQTEDKEEGTFGGWGRARHRGIHQSVY